MMRKFLCLFNIRLQADRFAAHNNITNRRLLWHGTNIAVVAAICKTGLRIMPHAGGRVGRGIYLASEHEKSYHYSKCEIAVWMAEFECTTMIPLHSTLASIKYEITFQSA